MLIRTSAIVAALFSVGCASTNSSNDDSSYASNDDESGVVCERYKPIGSNRIHKRCYSKEQADEMARRQREAEQNRRARMTGGGLSGDG